VWVNTAVANARFLPSRATNPKSERIDTLLSREWQVFQLIEAC
jgi:hypothetical protein